MSQLRYRGTEQEQVVTVYLGRHLDPSLSAQVLVERLMESTPNLPALRGNGCFLPTGASVGWDCEKIELRTAETSSNRGAVGEHLRLRAWVYETVERTLRQRDPSLTLEMSCGGACYATRKTFGTHFNIDLRVPNQPMVLEDLRTLYVIGLPFHGAGALRFGYLEPCWSAHIEGRAIQSLFSFKNVGSSGRCRLQIATSAGCCRSPLSLSLGFGWLTLIVAAIEAGLPSDAIPRFEDVNAAASIFNRDFDGTHPVSTSMGTLTLFDCLDGVFPVLRRYADTEDLAEICELLEPVLESMASQASRLATSHDPWMLRAHLHQLQTKHGFDDEELSSVNSAISVLAPLWQKEGEPIPDIASALLERFHALPKGGQSLLPLESSGSAMEAGTLDRFVAFRAEAEELYTRWPILERGFFDKLDRAGLLEYDQFEIGLPDHAAGVLDLTSARARVRGAFVSEHAGEPASYACTWDNLVDKKNGLTLAMTDPDKPATDWERLRPDSRVQPASSGLRRILPAIDVYLDESSRNQTSTIRSPRGRREPVVSGVSTFRIMRSDARASLSLPQQDPLSPLTSREDLEPCFGIRDVNRGCERGLIRLLRDTTFIRRQVATRSFADVAEETARSVARLIQVNSRRFDHEHVRLAFAKPLLKEMFRLFSQNYGLFGSFGDCLWALYQTIGPARPISIIASFVRIAGETLEETNWNDGDEMGLGFAIQFAAEVSDFRRLLAILQWAEESPLLRESPRIRHYRGEALQLYAQVCDDLNERCTLLQSSIEEFRNALDIPLFRGEQRERCEKAMARAGCDRERTRYFLGLGTCRDDVSVTLDWLRRRAERTRKVTAPTRLPFVLGGNGNHADALTRARECCVDNTASAQPHDISLNAANGEPTRGGHVSELMESVMLWTPMYDN